MPRATNKKTMMGIKGLSPIELPPADHSPTDDNGGTYVIYAAAPGEAAYDRLPGNDRDPNGLFARFLLRGLDDTTLSISQLMEQVSDQVIEAARRAKIRQRPHIASNLEGSSRITLAGLPAGTRPTPSPPIDAEAVLWGSVERGGTVADYEFYLRHYPQGSHAAAARARLASLRQSSDPPPKQGPPARESEASREHARTREQQIDHLMQDVAALRADQQRLWSAPATEQTRVRLQELGRRLERLQEQWNRLRGGP